MCAPWSAERVDSVGVDPREKERGEKLEVSVYKHVNEFCSKGKEKKHQTWKCGVFCQDGLSQINTKYFISKVITHKI